MPTKLTVTAVEESTYVISGTVRDEGGVLVVPNTLAWTLTDVNGVVINAREDVAVSPLAAEFNIVLSGDDLDLTEGGGTTRIVTIQGTYDSTLGSGLKIKDKVSFIIEDLEIVQ